jgi:hypothetical protein
VPELVTGPADAISGWIRIWLARSNDSLMSRGSRVSVLKEILVRLLLAANCLIGDGAFGAKLNIRGVRQRLV